MILKAAQHLRKTLTDHDIIVIHRRQKVTRGFRCGQIKRMGYPRVCSRADQLQIGQPCTVAAFPKGEGFWIAGGVIHHHHLVMISGRFQNAVHTQREHRRIGVVNGNEERNLHGFKDFLYETCRAEGVSI